MLTHFPPHKGAHVATTFVITNITWDVEGVNFYNDIDLEAISDLPYATTITISENISESTTEISSDVLNILKEQIQEEYGWPIAECEVHSVDGKMSASITEEPKDYVAW